MNLYFLLLFIFVSNLSAMEQSAPDLPEHDAPEKVRESYILLSYPYEFSHPDRNKGFVAHEGIDFQLRGIDLKPQAHLKYEYNHHIRHHWLSNTGAYLLTFPSQYDSQAENLDWWDLKAGCLKGIISKEGCTGDVLIDKRDLWYGEVKFSQNDRFILIETHSPTYSRRQIPRIDNEFKALLIDTQTNHCAPMDWKGSGFYKSGMADFRVRDATIFEDEQIIVFNDTYDQSRTIHGYSIKKGEIIWSQKRGSHYNISSDKKLFIIDHQNDSSRLFIHDAITGEQLQSLDVLSHCDSNIQKICTIEFRKRKNQVLIHQLQEHSFVPLTFCYDNQTGKLLSKKEEKLSRYYSPDGTWKASLVGEILKVCNMATKRTTSYDFNNLIMTFVAPCVFSDKNQFVACKVYIKETSERAILVVPLHEGQNLAHLPLQQNFINCANKKGITIKTEDFREQGEKLMTTINEHTGLPFLSYPRRD